MPIFEFTSPDGKAYEITAPEGATQAQAWDVLQSQIGAAPAPTQEASSPMPAGLSAGAEALTPTNEALRVGSPTPLEPDTLVEQTGPFEAALIGAGRSMSDLGRGIAEAAAPLVLTDAERADLPETGFRADEAENRAYDALRKEHPLATGLGEGAPYMAGGLGAGAALRGSGLLANLAGQAGTGATLGGAMPGSADERLTNAAMEGTIGLLGEGAGRTVARLAGGLGMRAAAPATQASADRAQEMGYKVLPSTRADSPLLGNVVEGGLESTPGGAVAFDAVSGQNQDLLNRAAAKAIGETAEEAPTDAVLDQAHNRIGGTFNRVMSKETPIPIDDDLLGQIIKIDEDSIAPMITGPEDPARRALDRAYRVLERGMDSGGISASELQKQQSLLGKHAWNARQTNPELSKALGDIQDALLQSAERHLPAADSAALKEARGQYRTLMNLTAGQNIDPVTGKVYAGRLASSLQRRDPRGFMRGQDTSDLYEGARFLGRTQTPKRSSGTAERTALREMTKFGGLGALAGGAGLQDVEGAATGGLLGLGGAVVAPNLAARAYLRPAMQRYLSREAGPMLQQGARAGGLGLLGLGAERVELPDGGEGVIVPGSLLGE